MLHTMAIASHAVRHQAVGKTRRPDGDPVAELKQMTRFEPIPTSAPSSLSAPFSVFDPQRDHASRQAGKLVFHAVGDTGGVNGTATQELVATAMESQIRDAADGEAPAFFYNLGDVVYYNGQTFLYKQEFYEPYQYYPRLIFAIPGNHDGDTQVRKNDAPDTESSLEGFLENFCDQQPRYVSPYRMTMTQPYPYWTLRAPFVTIIGLYSNVEGSLDARGRHDQQAFLEAMMRAAPKDEKLLITVHHPPFSLDSVHGGCPDILQAIDAAIQHSGRVPDAVLSGHVHNYQRFTRDVKGKQVPYVVAGAGGYANDPRSMHKLQKGVRAKLDASKQRSYQTTLPDVRMENYNEDSAGFLRVTVSADKLGFEYFTVAFGGDGTPELFEAF